MCQNHDTSSTLTVEYAVFFLDSIKLVWRWISVNESKHHQLKFIPWPPQPLCPSTHPNTAAGPLDINTLCNKRHSFYAHSNVFVLCYFPHLVRNVDTVGLAVVTYVIYTQCPGKDLELGFTVHFAMCFTHSNANATLSWMKKKNGGMAVYGHNPFPNPNWVVWFDTLCKQALPKLL